MNLSLNAFRSSLCAFARAYLFRYVGIACLCFFILQFFNRIEYPINTAETTLYMAPAEMLDNQPQPLLSLGDSQAYAGFFLQKMSPGSVRVGYYSSTGAILYSSPFDIVLGTLHKLHISMQELGQNPRLILRLDGNTILETRIANTKITNKQVVLGRNFFVKGLAQQFSGTLLPADSPKLERINYPFGISPYLAPLFIAALLTALVVMGIQSFFRKHTLSPSVVYTYLLCLVMYFGQLTDWTFAFLYPDIGLASFYDYQLQSLLQGHWDVPFPAINYEAFVHEGKYYGYFGPTPAFLRLPFALFPEMFGYWTRLMMSLSYALTLAFAIGIAHILWNIYQKNNENSTTLPPFLACFALLLFQFGTPAFFIASSASLYFEAISWGMMFSSVSVYYALQFCESQSNKAATIAVMSGALAFMSRVTLGALPLVFLGCILLWKLYTTYKCFKFTRPKLLLNYVALGLLALVGLTTFHAILYAKFETLHWPHSKHIQVKGERLDKNQGKAFFIENIHYNANVYLLTPVKIVKQFPFIVPTSLETSNFPEAKVEKNVFVDRGEIMEDVPGLFFTATTIIILSIVCCVYLMKLPSNLQLICSASLISCCIILFPLLLAVGNNYRYINDIFLPLFMLSMVGLFCIQKCHYAKPIMCMVLAANCIVNVTATIYNTGIYFTSSLEMKANYNNKIRFFENMMLR